MKFNNRYLIETPNGYQDFLGVKKSKNSGIIIEFDDGVIKCTEEHLIKQNNEFVKANTLKANDTVQGKRIVSISKDKEQFYYDPVQVQGDNTYIANELIHHNCLIVDETQFINTSRWNEFQDSIFPSQSGLAWKKNILLSTQNGMNHFYEIVKGAKKDENGFKLFEVSWKNTPRYKSDGSVYDNEEFKNDIIKKHGEVHFNQNYQNSFIGSSFTLIDAEYMKELKPKNALYTLSNKLNVFKEPELNHKYILTVDSSKNGGDFFGLGIYDISNFPFEEVAQAKLQVNYLQMPEFILEWAEMYNYAYVIIENNEGSGQSIADILYREYEYENLHFDKKINQKARKNKEYPGFRTTSTNRPTLIKTLKTFIEEGNLIIHDKELIEELNHFILKNGKYQADSGYHDDAVMKTQFLFVPFIDASNFDGYKSVIEALYTKESNKEFDFMETVVFGSFDQDATLDDFNDDENDNSDKDYENFF